MRKQVEQFIAKDSHAARLQTDDWNPGFDLRRKLVEDLEKQLLGTIEHAEVIDGPAGERIGMRTHEGEAGGVGDCEGGLRGGREKIMFEGAGPEEKGGAPVQQLVAAVDSEGRRRSPGSRRLP